MINVEELVAFENAFDEKTILKAEIMAAMLNGTCDWTYGCYLREKLDEPSNQ